MKIHFKENVTRGTSPAGGRETQEEGKSYMQHNASRPWTHKSAFTVQVLGSQAYAITPPVYKRFSVFTYLVLHFYVKCRKRCIKATFNVYIGKRSLIMFPSDAYNPKSHLYSWNLKLRLWYFIVDFIHKCGKK